MARRRVMILSHLRQRLVRKRECSRRVRVHNNLAPSSDRSSDRSSNRSSDRSSNRSSDRSSKGRNNNSSGLSRAHRSRLVRVVRSRSNKLGKAGRSRDRPIKVRLSRVDNSNHRINRAPNPNPLPMAKGKINLGEIVDAGAAEDVAAAALVAVAEVHRANLKIWFTSLTLET
jgi:hypothetical protein